MEMSAQKILQRAEELIYQKNAQEEVLEAIHLAETLSPNDALLLCRVADLLYRYGELHQKGRFFLLALNKLEIVKEIDFIFFNSSWEWSYLWGKILLRLGKLIGDDSFFESALQQFLSAEYIAVKHCQTLPTVFYWNWGEIWHQLGLYSGEPTDFQNGIQKFLQAQDLGERSPLFRISFGRVFVSFGELKGDSRPLEDAASLFRGVIADTYYPKEEVSKPFVLAFRELALCLKSSYCLTHENEVFEQADKVFQEAILASWENGDLWLDWGELFLHAGWINRDSKFVEIALEKLTSSKINQHDPFRVSALLGIGLVLIGLFFENLKLILEGKERIETALEMAPNQPMLLYASGVVNLGFALFYSESQKFSLASAFFEKCLELNFHVADCRHALFRTYFAWGVNQKDPSLIQKGIQSISLLSSLRPFSAHYLKEWGVALLQLRQHENDRDSQLEALEEAVIRFQEAYQLSVDLETLYHWGCALDMIGDLTIDEEAYEQAVEILKEVYREKPHEIQVCYHLGLALSHLGELSRHLESLEQAVQFLELVARSDSEDEMVACDLGYTYLNLSELIYDPVLPDKGETLRREAEKWLLKSVELGSEDAWYHLACLYSLANLCEASLYYLRKAQFAGYLPSNEELDQDEWLENVKKTPQYKEFQMLRDKNG